MIALKFVAAGLVVIAILCILLAIEEGLQWHADDSDNQT